LEAFASEFGPDFYGLPRNTGTITLVKEDWQPPASYAFGRERLVPMRANESVRWRLLTT
jgi:dihydroorotase